MNIDLDEKELRVLVQAMWLYNNRIKEIEQDLAQLKKEEEERAAKRKLACEQEGKHLSMNCYCCLGIEKKPEPLPFYKDYSYCVDLRDKLKKQQMIFPAEQHKEDKEYDYVTGPILNEKFGHNQQREKSKWVRCLSGHKYKE
jgi:hypothetical protein